MLKLMTGLRHFQSQLFESHRALFERLGEGQSPEVLFITCSDSRINPNLMTNTAPGDLFILRNAGNIIPPHGSGNTGESATIEFAITALGVKDIIVCGHSACGAVKGLLHQEKLGSMPAVKSWLQYAEATRKIVEDNYSHLNEEDKLNVAIQENVLVQIENLRTLPAVASGLVAGKLRIHGWTYKFQTGEVFSYSQEEGQFVPAGDVDYEKAQARPKMAASAI